MPDFLNMLTPALFAFAFGVTMLGGFVEGAVGFAQPLIMISGLGVFIAPDLVVAGIIIPIVVANFFQVLRAGLGPAKAALRDPCDPVDDWHVARLAFGRSL